MSSNVSSEVQVANLALQRLGIAAVSALTGSDKPAAAANRIFADTRDEVQRMFPWACLITREAFTAHTISNSALPYRHTMDVTALSVLEVIDTSDAGAENIPFKREYRYLYTTKLTGYVRFTTQTTNITPWDPLMLSAIECRMASKLAVWLTGNFQMAQYLHQEFMQIIMIAIQTKAIEEKFDDNAKLLAMIDKSFLPFLSMNRAISEAG